MSMISVDQVAFAYAGGKPVLTDIDFQAQGGVTGLIGPNGAGKTTFLRLLLGALLPSRGDVRIDGQSPSDYLKRRPIGWVGDNPCFDGFLRVGEFIDFLGRLSRAPAHAAFGTDVLRDALLGTLSHGQCRRVQIAAALIGGTSVLLLDEPTNGLDPSAIRQLRRLLEELREQEITIVLSSHNLDELQRVADRFALLSSGRLIGMFDRPRALAQYGSVDLMFAHYFEEGA